jgi:hypothetical protein
VTIENTATCWRDLTDQLTAQQVSMLASDEQCADMFDAESLLFMVRDLAALNAAELVDPRVVPCWHSRWPR